MPASSAPATTAAHDPAMSKSTINRCQPVDIEFQDLSYSVADFSGGRNTILKSMSGSFRAGQLTAILGPSGAGKSTLLNVLVGLLNTGVTGSITTNGHPRQTRTFHKLSTYIMQEDLIQPRISVQEAMEVAAHLKLGSDVSCAEKLDTVNDVLNALGLECCRHTRTEKLSGGQRKRLSVAMELVNNPPIIFLDEPTTGLDVVTVKQCVSILKLLVKQGRTVVCTMHQPTSTLFQQLDNVYFMARGMCVYQGSPNQFVPFLSSLNMNCPMQHDPADFVMEIIQEENYVENIMAMSSEIQNGKIHYAAIDKRSQPAALLSGQDKDEMSYQAVNNSLQDISTPSSCYQFQVLLKRMYRQKFRNKVSLWIQIFHHVAIGIAVGILFFNAGADANKPFTNFKMIICVSVFFMYTQMIIPALTFPTEVHLLKREYLNHWYGLKPYFMALVFSTVPLQIILGSIFSIIVYLLSGQPMEWWRFLLFNLSGLLCGLVSEGHGLMVGAIFNHVNGAIVAPATLCPLLALSVYGMGYGANTESFMVFLQSLSYMRYALVSLTVSVFGLGRTKMHCDHERWVFCMYEDPDLLLRDLGMNGTSIWQPLTIMVFFLLIYRVTIFLALRVQLMPDFHSRTNTLIRKVLRK